MSAHLKRHPRRSQELWQPLIYNERRFPHESFLEGPYRCPLPTTLVTRAGITTGVVADPTEYPFQPLPNLANSRFGVAVRNARGQTTADAVRPAPAAWARG